MCAEIVAQKLQSYYTQAEEYHNQCLQGNALKNVKKVLALLGIKMSGSRSMVTLS